MNRRKTVNINRTILKSFYAQVKDFKQFDKVVEFLFSQVLADSYYQTEFKNKIVMMMARQAPDRWNPDLASEFMRQIRLVLWILGPVWLANGRSLPCMSVSELKEAIGHEVKNDWDDYFAQFKKHDPLWQEIINDQLNSLTMPSSRIIVGRITRVFFTKLPESMLVG